MLGQCTETKTVTGWIDVIFPRIWPQAKSELSDVLSLDSSQVRIAGATPALCLIWWSDQAGCSGRCGQCITSLEKIEKVGALFGIVKGVSSEIHGSRGGIWNTLLRSNDSGQRWWATSACSSTSRSYLLKFQAGNSLELCSRSPSHRRLRLPRILHMAHSFQTHLRLLWIAHAAASLGMISAPELPS